MKAILRFDNPRDVETAVDLMLKFGGAVVASVGDGAREVAANIKQNNLLSLSDAVTMVNDQIGQSNTFSLSLN